MIQSSKESTENDEEKDETPAEKPPSAKVKIPDEAYYMVAQVHWEDDIIWNGEDAKQKVMQSQKTRGPMAGWVPSSTHRTTSQFQQQGSLCGSSL